MPHASEAECPAPGKNVLRPFPTKSYADGEEPTIREIPQFTGGITAEQVMPEGFHLESKKTN